jgi:hypothetical protein
MRQQLSGTFLVACAIMAGGCATGSTMVGPPICSGELQAAEALEIQAKASAQNVFICDWSCPIREEIFDYLAYFFAELP